MKFLRTNTEALSCESVRSVKVSMYYELGNPSLPEGFVVTITYEQGEQLELRVGVETVDLSDTMARYIQARLLNQIISFLNKGDTESVGGYTIPTENSFSLEDAVHDILKRFECNEEEA